MHPWHGTHVTGIIASKDWGAAPDSRIYYRGVPPLSYHTYFYRINGPVFLGLDNQFRFIHRFPNGIDLVVDKDSDTAMYSAGNKLSDPMDTDEEFPWIFTEKILYNDLTPSRKKRLKSFMSRLEESKHISADLIGKIERSPNLASIVSTLSKQKISDRATNKIQDLLEEWVDNPDSATVDRSTLIQAIVVNPDYDAHFAQTINDINQKGIQIINLSQGIALGPKSINAIIAFKKSGGIIVKALGNEGTVLHKKSQRSAEVSGATKADVNTHLEIQKNPELRLAFLFVANLDDSGKRLYRDDLEEKGYGKGSNLPGSSIANRTIAAWGTGVESTYQEAQGDGSYTDTTKKETGTSMAAPKVAGIIAALKTLLKKCSANFISNTLLETADSLGALQSFVFGKGRINAERTFKRLSTKCR